MTKLLTVVTLISASLLVLLAGIFTSTTEKYFPNNADSTLLLSLDNSPIERQDLFELLDRWEAESGSQLYLRAPADENRNGLLLYEIGASDSTPRELRQFLPWQQAEILPQSAVGDRNLASSYVAVGANASDRDSLTESIALIGGETRWTLLDHRLIAIQSVIDSGAALALVTSGVMFITCILMWVLSRARKHDLQFLAGASNREIISEDVRVLLRSGVLPIAGVFCVSVACVLLVSGTRFVATFMSALLLGVAGLLVVAAVTWGLALSLSWPIRKALAARELPGGGFGGPSEVLRLVALGITALSLPFLVSGLLGTRESANQAEEWSRLDGWVSVRAGSIDQDLEAPLRNATSQLAANDDIALSRALQLNQGAGTSTDTPPGLSIIITDRRFIELMGAGPIDGSDWEMIEKAELTTTASELLSASIPLWVDDPAGLDAPGLHLLRWQGDEPFPAIEALTGEMSFNDEPVVLVADDASSFTGDMLLAALSSGNLLFSSTDSVREAFENNDAAGVILSVDRAADAGLLRAQLLNQTLWLRWVSLGLVVGALALSTSIGAEVWARRLSRRIFVLRTAGFSWSWIARRRLLWEFASAAVMTAMGGWFLLQLQLSPWWVLLLPPIYVPVSAYLHTAALKRRFNSIVVRTA